MYASAILHLCTYLECLSPRIFSNSIELNLLPWTSSVSDLHYKFYMEVSRFATNTLRCPVPLIKRLPLIASITKCWMQISHPFPNLNGGAVEVSQWINNVIPHFTGHVITYRINVYLC